MSGRWVRLFIPKTWLDKAVFGREPHVINEAPKHPLLCVMLASDQETGLFARKALPPPREAEE
jgi:hypothetical protein